ncbi:hypothetical protein [endosymbiont GvMRE of Glomus versiforme]|uniref:hypothetical protein n=1 Tax=endosymbiont GvMRE of Glomus versiforme TaxID=2039283 RepID=UPI000ECB165E|nr:hypothetical protein [endosymbiont GvMRE of Glomus versiforme]RHZ37309.1 hypothetical protein GvMRE_I1g412 [endosymbiont GvMRE of Glomus versiforme]
MNDLETEIKNICDEIETPQIEVFSWKWIRELYNKGIEKSSLFNESDKRETSKNSVIYVTAKLIIEIVKEISFGEEAPPECLPTSDDLNFFEKVNQEVPALIKYLEKNSREGSEGEGMISIFKAGSKQLKSFIQEQRKKLGSSQKPTNKPNLQDQQKIQNQQKEIDYLKQQLAELQKQITELKQNQKDTDAKPEITKKIETLESKKQEIQSELNKKQSQQKELKDKANSSQSNNSDNGFKWWYVAIPSAILLVIMGIVIAYLMGKNKKKH